ncbi:MAG: hypothetical protein CTY16_11080 [Methylobacter sp.]|nr:MAG: hypothetical protein CTY16_11080 [Methylobacter sp.]
MTTKKPAKRIIKTPKQIQRALVLREAGYSIAAISVKTAISPATLTRHFKKHGAVRGSLSLTAVEDARQELLSDSGFIGELRHQIAASITDDMAHVVALRESMALILEEIMKDAALPSHYKSRAIAALATSLTLTQKAARIALSVDDQPVEQDQLPTLHITELTADDIFQMRNEQIRLNEEMGISCEAIEVVETTG